MITVKGHASIGGKDIQVRPREDSDKDTKKNLHCKRQCGQKEYTLNTIDNEPLHPINNSFINNTIMADNGKKAPTLLKC